MRRVGIVVFGSVILAGAGVTARAGESVERGSNSVSEWKETLAAMSVGVWLTSNEAYLDEDAGTEAYAMAFRVQPGGMSATGCLWAIGEGGTTSVAWRFFQAWDPTRESGMLYQSQANGLVGFGHFQEIDGEPQLVQDFLIPDGRTFRTGHYETMDGPDVRITRSVDWTGGEWSAGRNYTWHRRADGKSACE